LKIIYLVANKSTGGKPLAVLALEVDHKVLSCFRASTSCQG
jgi:hypothetical protein